MAWFFLVYLRSIHKSVAASKPECVTIFGALLPSRCVCLFLKEIMDDKLTAKVTTTGRTKNPLRFTFHQHLARAKIPYGSPPTLKWERKHRRKKYFLGTGLSLLIMKLIMESSQKAWYHPSCQSDESVCLR